MSLPDPPLSYCDAKPVWSPAAAAAAPRARGAAPAHALSGVPQLRALFAEADERARRVEALARACERRLADALRRRAVPDDALCAAIAVLKVRAVEASIDDCWRLKQEVRVGSLAFAPVGAVSRMKLSPRPRAPLRALPPNRPPPGAT